MAKPCGGARLPSLLRYGSWFARQSLLRAQKEWSFAMHLLFMDLEGIITIRLQQQITMDDIEYELELNVRDIYYQLLEYEFRMQLEWQTASRNLAEFFAERQIDFEQRGSRYDNSITRI